MSTESSWLVLALAVPILFSVFWTLSSTGSPFTAALPTLHNKRICLLIAHPDDEAMFFSPTVLALTKPELGNHVKILCLSTGDADGLGDVRKKEIEKSAVHLGLRHESDVFVIDDTSRFPDSMTIEWSARDISTLLASAFAPEMSPASGLASGRNANGKGAADGAPKATIDVIITFDERGVSNHPNHRSLYHGSLAFLKGLMKDKSGYSCPVALYTLTSTNIVRKYSGIFDSPVTMLFGAFANARDSFMPKKSSRDHQGYSNRLLYVSGFNQWTRARIAMTDGHKSQMLWFRWGWITVGRYMFVNDLKREKI